MCFGGVQAAQTEFWTVRNLESFIATLRQDALLSAADLPLSAVRWTRSEVLRSHGRKSPDNSPNTPHTHPYAIIDF